jgi:metallophosphoesterase superfamily enzyme
VGHVHPVVRHARLRGQSACYLIGPRRIVLPAFSDDAAGLNVLRVPAWQTDECHAIVGAEVLPLGPVAALRRRLDRFA